MERMLNIREWAMIKYAKPVKQVEPKKRGRPSITPITYDKPIAAWCDTKQQYIYTGVKLK